MNKEEGRALSPSLTADQAERRNNHHPKTSRGKRVDDKKFPRKLSLLVRWINDAIKEKKEDSNTKNAGGGRRVLCLLLRPGKGGGEKEATMRSSKRKKKNSRK